MTSNKTLFNYGQFNCSIFKTKSDNVVFKFFKRVLKVHIKCIYVLKVFVYNYSCNGRISITLDEFKVRYVNGMYIK